MNSIAEDLDKYLMDRKNRISPELMGSLQGDLIYYFGIIDTLTYFGGRKFGEYILKRTFQGKGISCVPSKEYQARFMGFIKRIFSSDQEKSVNGK